MATQALSPEQGFTYRRSPTATEAFEGWLKEHGQELPKHTEKWDVTRSDIYVEDRWQPIFAEMRREAPVNKVHEGRPHIVDMIVNNEIAMVINSVQEKRAAIRDSYHIRRAALHDQVPTFTTIAGARAAALGMQGMRELVPFSMQALHRELPA